MTATVIERVPAELGRAGKNLTHVVCCDTNVALCGTDVTHSSWVGEDAETTCSACALIATEPCPSCGW